MYHTPNLFLKFLKEIIALNSLKPVHADELLYLFDIDMLPNALVTPEELDMRKTLVKYWTNFAKFKHPSPSAEEGVTQWLPYSSAKVYS